MGAAHLGAVAQLRLIRLAVGRRARAREDLVGAAYLGAVAQQRRLRPCSCVRLIMVGLFSEMAGSHRQCWRALKGLCAFHILCSCPKFLLSRLGTVLESWVSGCTSRLEASKFRVLPIW